MPRAMSTAMQTAIAERVLSPAIFVEAWFRNGPVYLWSGMGSLSWNGQTWIGLGALGGISPLEDAGTVEARGITLTLSGIDPAILPDALAEMQLGLAVTVYLALFNEGVVIADPITAWAGRMDQPTVDVDGQKATLSINCENRLVDMNVAVDRRYTAEDQQLDYPGDLGLNFVNEIQEITFYVGVAPVAAGNI